MAENRKAKDKRYYFSRGQMALLGGAFTLASVIIFLLGIFAGKEIEERRIAKTEEPLVKIPVKPSGQDAAAGRRGQSKDELTFYDTLTKSPGKQPLVEEKPVEIKAPVKMTSERVKDSKPQVKEGTPPSSKGAEKETAAAPAQAPKVAQTAETAERIESGKGWTVQVNAFPDERSAKLLVERLKNKGYKAVITEARSKGKSWHRVRVGRFNSREEADKLVETLKTRDNYTTAFATSR